MCDNRILKINMLFVIAILTSYSNIFSSNFFNTARDLSSRFIGITKNKNKNKNSIFNHPWPSFTLNYIILDSVGMTTSFNLYIIALFECSQFIGAVLSTTESKNPSQKIVLYFPSIAGLIFLYIISYTNKYNMLIGLLLMFITAIPSSVYNDYQLKPIIFNIIQNIIMIDLLFIWHILITEIPLFFMGFNFINVYISSIFDLTIFVLLHHLISDDIFHIFIILLNDWILDYIYSDNSEKSKWNLYHLVFDDLLKQFLQHDWKLIKYCVLLLIIVYCVFSFPMMLKFIIFSMTFGGLIDRSKINS